MRLTSIDGSPAPGTWVSRYARAVSTPLPNNVHWSLPRLGLPWRAGMVAAVLAVETLLISYLIQQTPIDWVTGSARVVRDVQHWVFRFLIVYAVTLATLAYLRGVRSDVLASRFESDVPLRGRWLGLHLGLMLPFAGLSEGLYSGSLPMPFVAVSIAWHVFAVGAAAALLAAAAPFNLWTRAVRQTGILPLYALFGAVAAVLAIQASQRLWQPTAQLTFQLVHLVLRPLYPGLHADFATLTVATARFAVTVSDQCSGLEGIGLILVFTATWLAYFRREYRFPRALIILPVAVLLVFGLNAIRIAALVMIGDAGHPGIAMIGFHSQAGWIVFNLVALGMAMVAKHSSWLNRAAAARAVAQDAEGGGTLERVDAADPTAAYLLPFLAILATGMIAHALSAGFELLYPLRFLAAITALWVYRRSYAALDWRCSWRGVAVGVAVGIIWLLYARIALSPVARPEGLAALAPPLRFGWIAVRTLAATVTVPIAEELAFRGYLLRRLITPDFAAVKLAEGRGFALLMSSIVFGVTHASLWLPGIIAGLAYGAIAIRRGRIGEAVAAHAASNALLAIGVLRFDQWQLW